MLIAFLMVCRHLGLVPSCAGDSFRNQINHIRKMGKK